MTSVLCTATMACAADSLVENLIKEERETMRVVVVCTYLMGQLIWFCLMSIVEYNSQVDLLDFKHSGPLLLQANLSEVNGLTSGKISMHQMS